MRYIDMTPTWAEAMQILIACLENGTGEGREAARKELRRVAVILDDMNRQKDEPTQLYDVITHASTDHPAAISFGQTFGHEETAEAYAKAMQAAGYRADVSPAFETQPSLTDALTQAAEFYGHPEILDALKEQEANNV